VDLIQDVLQPHPLVQTFFQIRVEAVDVGGVAGAAASQYINSQKMDIVAGSTYEGIGSSAFEAVFNYYQTGKALEPQIAVAQDGTIYFNHAQNGIVRVDPITKNTEYYIKHTDTTSANGLDHSLTTATEVTALTLDYQDRLIYLDSDEIRRVEADGTVNTIVGGGATFASGTAALSFDHYSYNSGFAQTFRSITPAPNGDLYFESYTGGEPDYERNTWKYTEATGLVTEIQKSGSGYEDNAVIDVATQLRCHGSYAFPKPYLDLSDSSVRGYFAYCESTNGGTGGKGLLELNSTAVSVGQAGMATVVGTYDNNINSPKFIMGRDGKMYMYSRAKIFVLNAAGTQWDQIAGGAYNAYQTSVDGTAALGNSIHVSSMWAAADGTIYFAERGKIRVIQDGNIQTIFGQGYFYGDGGLATNARLSEIANWDWWNDGTNDYVVIMDYTNVRIREAQIGGNINTIAGNGANSSGSFNVDATTIPMLMNGYVSHDFAVDPSNGWVYRAITGTPSSSYALARLDRTDGQWKEWVVGSSANPYQGADGTSNPFFDWDFPVIGFDTENSKVLMYAQDDYYEDQMIKQFSTTTGIQEHVVGIVQATSNSDDFVAVVPATNDTPTTYPLRRSEENARASRDTVNDRWIIGAAKQYRLLSITPTTVNEFYMTDDLKESFVYLDFSDELYYCTYSGGLKYRDNPEGAGVEVAQDSFVDDIHCEERVMVYSPSQRSIMFNGKNGEGAWGIFKYKVKPATVDLVTAVETNGTYGPGQTINVRVQFNEDVVVDTTGGTPYITLETGTTDRNATYVSGNETNTLVFQYTIQAGDSSADLDYVATNSLNVNGGSIKDAYGIDVDTTLPTPGASGSLADSKDIEIADLLLAYVRPDCTAVPNPTPCFESLYEAVDDSQVTGAHPIYVALSNSKDLVTNSKNLRVIIQEEWTSRDIQEVRMSGWTTSAANKITITAEGLARHDGTTNGNFYTLSSSNNSEDTLQIGTLNTVSDTQYTELDGFIITREATTTSNDGLELHGDNSIIENMIFYDTQSAGAQAAINIESDNQTLTIRNTLIYGNVKYGIKVQNAGDGSVTNSNINIYQTTIANSPHAPSSAALMTSGNLTGTNLDVRNSILHGDTGASFGAAPAPTYTGSTNNMSEDSNGPGLLFTTTSIDDVLPGSDPGTSNVYVLKYNYTHLEDFHLANNTWNDAQGNGADLSGLVDKDVDGQIRTAPYDIGFDQYGAYDEKAFELAWVEAQPITSLDVTATWSKATNAGLTEQQIVIYQNDNCTGTPIAGPTALGTAATTYPYTMPSYAEYTFKIISTVGGQDYWSTCSMPMAPSWFNDEVTVIEVAKDGSGDIYVGGNFTEYKGTVVNRIIRLNSDFTHDTAFNTGTGFNGLIRDIEVARDDSGDVFVAGQFTDFNGNTRNRLIKLNSDGTEDAGFTTGTGFDNTVRDIEQYPDGNLYVVGNFNTYNGATSQRLIRLNVDGTHDTSFAINTTGFTGELRSVTVQPDDISNIYVSGNFTDYGGDAGYKHLMRFNTDGNPEYSWLNDQATLAVSNVLPYADGNGDLFVGGTTGGTYSGNTANGFFRVNKDGTWVSDVGYGCCSVPDTELSVDGQSAVYLASKHYPAYTVYVGAGRINIDNTDDVTFANAMGDGLKSAEYWEGVGADIQAITQAVDASGRVYLGGRFFQFNNDWTQKYFTVVDQLSAGTMPYVTNVDAFTADGTYDVGDTIDIDINMSEAVNLTGGNASLFLRFQNTIREATCLNNQLAVTAIRCSYTVVSPDNTLDLDYRGEYALFLPAGVSVSAVAAPNNKAQLILPIPGTANSLSGTSNIQVMHAIFLAGTPLGAVGATEGSEAASGDFNEDGNIDLIREHGSNTYYHAGNGDGTFNVTGVSLGSTGGESDYDVADFDGDGHQDIFVSRNGFANVFFWGVGNGTFSQVSLNAEAYESRGTAVADFDGDGDLDLVVTNHDAQPVQYFENLGARSFAAGVNLFTPTTQRFVEAIAGDFNNDGHMDVVASAFGCADGLYLQGNGDGTFQAGAARDFGDGGCQKISVADFNLDGNLDVLTASSNDQPSIHMGNGDGTFGATVPIGTDDQNSSKLLIGDFNLDGYPDFVVPNESENNFGGLGKPQNRVYLNNKDVGTSTFTEVGFTQDLATNIFESEGGVVGDFNKDGLPDVMVMSESDGNEERAHVYLNSGHFVNAARPAIVYVTSSNPDATYGTGDEIIINVEFDQPVIATNVRGLRLETGISDSLAIYQGGSGTTTLTFSYIVNFGDSSSDLEVSDFFTSIELGSGGSITNLAATEDAIFSLPQPTSGNSLSDLKDIVIDGQDVLAIVHQTCTDQPTPCYNSLSLALDDTLGTVVADTALTNKNLVTNNTKLVVRIRGEWTAADTGIMRLTGWTTDATRFIDVKTVGLARHDGTIHGNYYRIDPVAVGHAIEIASANYTVMDGLIITDLHGDSSEAFRLNSNEITVRNSIVHNLLQNSQQDAFYTNNGAGNLTLHLENIIAYNIERAFFHAQQSTGADNVTINIRNCTGYNIGYDYADVALNKMGGIGFDYQPAETITNHTFNVTNTIMHTRGSNEGELAYDISGVNGNTWGTSSNNISSDGSAPGGASLTNVNFTDLVPASDPGTLNVYFVSLDPDTWNLNLVNVPWNEAQETGVANGLALDIQGESRPSGLMDAGADEFDPELRANSLAWVQSSPYAGGLAVTSSWTKATNVGLTNQYIQYYADETCSTPSGTPISLTAVPNSHAFVAPTRGVYTYKVTSFVGSDEYVSFCSKPMAIVQEIIAYVRPDCTAEPNPTPCYETLSTAIDDASIAANVINDTTLTGQDLVSQNARLKVEIQSAWLAAEATNDITISGWTTDKYHDITVTATGVARNDGTVHGAFYTLQPDPAGAAIELRSNFITLDGFIIDGSNAVTDASGEAIRVAADGAVIKNMIIHDFTAGNMMDGIYIGGTDNGSNTNTLIMNNIIYNIARQALDLQGTSANPLAHSVIKAYNNTVYNARINPQNANSIGFGFYNGPTSGCVAKSTMLDMRNNMIHVDTGVTTALGTCVGNEGVIHYQSTNNFFTDTAGSTLSIGTDNVVVRDDVPGSGVGNDFIVTSLNPGSENLLLFNHAFNDGLGASTRMTLVSSDIQDEPRPFGTTDLGADEMNNNARAVNLAWVESSPFNGGLTVNSTWTKALAGTLTEQTIQYYSDATCTTTSGAPIALGTAATSHTFNAPAEGTYTYKITSTISGTDYISPCSKKMLITTLINLVADTPAANAKLGKRVDIEGEFLVANAFGENSTYVFKYNGTNWIQTHKLEATSTTPNGTTSFAYDAVLNDDWLFVSDRLISPNGAGTRGAVFSYRYDGTDWNYHSMIARAGTEPYLNGVEHILEKSGGVDGDVMAVGVRDANGMADTDVGTDGGAVYIYRFNGTSWAQEQILISPLSGGGDPKFFGESTYVHGDVIAVGERPNQRVYIYRYNGTTWALEDTILQAEVGLGASNNAFGGRVSVHGDWLLISNINYNGTNARGAVSILKHDGAGNWVHQQNLLPSDAMDNMEFGDEFQVFGNRIVVGAENYNTDVGRAYIYEFDGSQVVGSQWSEVERIENPTPSSGDLFADNIRTSGAWVVMGNSGDDDENALVDSGTIVLRSYNEATKPYVTSINATTPDGTYNTGAVISITVNFNEIVTVSNGTPELLLDLGSYTRKAVYTTGSGSSALTFQYTVAAGDMSTDLDVVSRKALLPNGSNIKNASSIEASYVLPSTLSGNNLAANADIVIDTTALLVKIQQNCGALTPPDCYTSLNDWHTNFVADSTLTDKDLSTQQKRIVVEIDGPWTAPDTTRFTLSGWTTDATYNIHIKAVGEARHQGFADGDHYKFDPNTDGHAIIVGVFGNVADTQYTTFEGIDMRGTSGSSAEGFRVYADNTLFDGMLIHDMESDSDWDGDQDGIQAEQGNITLTVRNSIFYNIHRSAINNNNSVRPVTLIVENVTAYNTCTRGMTYGAYYGLYPAIGFMDVGDNTGNNLIIKNTVAHCKNGTAEDNGPDYLITRGATVDAASTNNYSTDGTAPGSNPTINVSFRDTIPADDTGNDFIVESLVPGQERLLIVNNAFNDGTDGGADLSASFTNDIHGETRSVPFSIGADQFNGVNPATELAWAQTSPHKGGLSVNSTWTPASSGSLTAQSIQYYADATCTTASGGPVALGAAITTHNFVAPSAGVYSYIVTSTVGGTDYDSLCSAPLYIIQDIMAYVRPDCTAQPNPAPCYESLALAIDDANVAAGLITDTALTGKDLVADFASLTVEIQSAWAAADTTAVTVSGWTTDKNSNITIKTTGEARHDGTVHGDFYELDPAAAGSAIRIGVDGSKTDTQYTTIDGLIITGVEANYNHGVFTNAFGSVIKNNILYGLADNGHAVNGAICVGGNAGNTEITAYNNIIYGRMWNQALNIEGGPNVQNSIIRFYHNTVYNVNAQPIRSAGPAEDYTATVLDIRNNILHNYGGSATIALGGATLPDIHPSSGNNTKKDATALGTGDLDNTAYTDIVPGTDPGGNNVYFTNIGLGEENLMLAGATFDSARNGASTIASITTDIQGDSRPYSGPEIGADENNPINGAIHLGWVEDSPYSGGLSVNSTWTKSVHGGLTEQTIQYYADATCTTTSGAPIALGTTATTHNFVATVAGVYSYKITSTIAGSDYPSTCSQEMDLANNQMVVKIMQNCGALTAPDCYTSLSAWHTNYVADSSLTDKDLATQQKKIIVQIDGPWTAPDTTPVTISGWTTDVDYNITITAINEARHNGSVHGNFYVLDPSVAGHAITVGTDANIDPPHNVADSQYTTFDGFIITGVEGTSNEAFRVGATNTVIENMIIHDLDNAGDDQQDAIHTRNHGVTLTVRNNIFYNIERQVFFAQAHSGSMTGGVSWENLGSTYNLYNNTMYNICYGTTCASAIGTDDYGDQSTSVLNLYNNIIDCANSNDSEGCINNGGGGAPANEATINADYNTYNTPTYDGSTIATNDVNGAVFTDVVPANDPGGDNIYFNNLTAGAENFTLYYVPYNDALGRGMDASAFLTTDIQGETRTPPYYDLGADEYDGVGNATNLVWDISQGSASLTQVAQWTKATDAGLTTQSITYYNDGSCGSVFSGPTVVGLNPTHSVDITPGATYTYKITSTISGQSVDSQCSDPLVVPHIALLREDCTGAPLPNCYQTITAWHTANGGLGSKDLVTTENTSHVLLIQDEWTNYDTITGLDITGWTTDASHTLTIKAEGAARHTGTPWGNFYRLAGDPTTTGNALLLLSSNYVTLDGFVINGKDATGLSYEGIRVAADEIMIKNMIVHNFMTDTQQDAIYTSSSNIDFTVMNTVMFDINRSALLVQSPNAQMQNTNVKIYNVFGSGKHITGGTAWPTIGYHNANDNYGNFNNCEIDIRNTIAITNNTTNAIHNSYLNANSGSWAATSSHNIVNDDGTYAPQTFLTTNAVLRDNVPSVGTGKDVIVTDNTSAYKNFMLRESAFNDAIGGGTNIASIIPFDIQGEPTYLPMDVGADQYDGFYRAQYSKWNAISPYDEVNIVAQWTRATSPLAVDQKITYYGNGSCTGAPISGPTSLTMALNSDAFVGTMNNTYSFNITTVDVNGTEYTAPCSLPMSLSALRRVIAGDADRLDQFGKRVQINAGRFATTEQEDGDAYIFNFDGTNWVEDFSDNYVNRGGSGTGQFEFGYSSSIEGEWAAINDYTLENDGLGTGGVNFMYRWDGTNWAFHSQVGRLTADGDNTGGNCFSEANSIDGEWMIYGCHQSTSPGDPIPGTNGGAAFVYRFNGSDWVRFQRLDSPNVTDRNKFGRQTAINGNFIVVTATSEDRVYVFKFDGSSWVLNDTLAPADSGVEASTGRFGDRLAIHGDVIVVNSPLHDGAGTDRGAVVVYRYNGTDWTTIAPVILTASDGVDLDEFSDEITVYGNNIVVGAEDFNALEGRAYVYSWNGTIWSEAAIISSPTGEAGARFGDNVSLSGNTLGIAAPFEDTGSGVNAGALYIQDVYGDATPYITSVEATTANGTYGAGTNIDIVVNFSESVTVANGTPELLLETGDTDRVAIYQSGSPGTALTFRYIVQAGDSSPDLDIFSTNALNNKGATIKNGSNYEASLVLPVKYSGDRLAENADIVIDTQGSRGFDNVIRVVKFVNDGSGDFYVGGQFTTYDGETVNRIVRLNRDYSIDWSFNMDDGAGNIGFSGTVWDIEVLNNGQSIAVVGDFSTYKGLAANRIVVLDHDGSINNDWAAAGNVVTNSPLATRAVMQANDGSDDIYFGGRSSTIGGVSQYFHRFSGSDYAYKSLSGYGSGVTGSTTVIDMEQSPDGSGDIVISITSTGAQTYNGNAFAKYLIVDPDGNFDGSFYDANEYPDNVVYDVTFERVFDITNTTDHPRVYIGGQFTSFTSTQVAANTAQLFGLLDRDGALNTTYAQTGTATATGTQISEIINTVDGSGDMWVFGSTATIKGATQYGIARLNSAGADTTPAYIGNGATNATEYVHSGDISIDGNNLLVIGGTFTNINGSAQAQVAIIDLKSDTTAKSPTIVRVYSPLGASELTSGTVSIYVDFSENVTITGTPYILLNLNGVAAKALYVGMVDGDTAEFQYTITPGDEAGDLNYINEFSLMLDGGSITSTASGNVATVILPNVNDANSLGSQEAIIINTVGPLISDVYVTEDDGVTLLADGTYTTTDQMSVVIAFDSQISVTGTPQIDMGATIPTLNCAAHPSYNFALKCDYTVGAGQAMNPLDYAGTGALTGGTIEDNLSQAATLTLASVGLSGSITDEQSITIVDTPPTPTITNVNPTTVNDVGGVTVTITGTNFIDGLSIIYFGGKACENTVFVNATTLTCAMNYHVPGTYDVVVENSPTVKATDVNGITFTQTVNHITDMGVGYTNTYMVEFGGILATGTRTNYAIGNNNNSGNATTPESPTGLAPLSGRNITQVSGNNRSASVLENGGVYAWGGGSFYATGISTTADQATPVNTIAENNGVSKLAADSHLKMMTVTEGGLETWGYGGINACSQGKNSDVTEPGSHSQTPRFEQAAGSGVTAVDGSQYHTCFTINGGLRCYGRNGGGQVTGDGTTSAYECDPQTVYADGSGITDLAVGGHHTCVIKNGGIWCWGANSEGELGDGTTTPRSTPTEILAAGSGATEIAAGYFCSGECQAATCAVIKGGVQCWGTQRNGILGDGVSDTSAPYTYRTTPYATIAAGSGAHDLVMYGTHACVRTSNGTSGIECWGAGWNGQLLESGSSIQNTPQDATVVEERHGLEKVVAGNDHACFLSDAGIKCYGDNTNGELGNATTTASLTAVTPISYTDAPTDLAAANGATCAIYDEGEVKCWGNNADGRVGNNSSAGNTTSPTAIDTASKGYTSISGKYDHFCAVYRGGLKCWGDGANGKLGNGIASDELTPYIARTTSDAVESVSAGKNHTCYVAKGGVKCIGKGDDGQLGDGLASNSFAWVNALAVGSGVTEVAAGGDHTCAIINNGVKCWGANTYGQLGISNANADEFSPPTTWTIAQNSAVQDICVGENHSCAVVAGGVQCWGRNDAGQVGTNSSATASYTTPQTILAADSGATHVSCGHNSTHITIHGEIVNFGANSSGQLGNEKTTSEQHRPVYSTSGTLPNSTY
jgi:alpha-tubulin suppressor-like RCC1 family protein